MKDFTARPAKQQTEYLRAVPSGTADNRDITKRPNWEPPKWEPVRPGADDHKQYTSKGTRFTADQMQAYATAARADLEAENNRLREALELFDVYVKAMESDDHVAGMLAYGQFEDAARAALEGTK